MTTSTAAKAPASSEFTHRQILTILSGLLLGMFLAALDQTIVSTAIPRIANDLHDLSAQAWVTTAYLITSTITTPIYGKLGDIYGRKKLFTFAIGVFILGSAMCSFSTSMYELAAFRAFQGIGAGGLMTLVLAIIGDLVPPRERAKYTGYFMATFGTSSVLGPVVGGFLAGANSFLGVTGWRWVFLVNVPIGIVALFVVNATLHLPPHARRDTRIDWWGAVALVVALVPLLTVAEQGRTWGWGSVTSIACYVIGVGGVLGFVWIERAMGVDALIPLRIFKLRAASVTIIASVIVGIGMFGGITVLPLYMQIVHGASPMDSGLMMLPMVAGMMIASVVSGLITAATGRIRGFPIFGTAIGAVAFGLMWVFVTADSNLVWVMAMMFLLGLGLGQCMQPLTLIVHNAVTPSEIGVATSAATFFRQTGGTIGVAVFLSILFSTLGNNIQSALTSAMKADPSLASPANQQIFAKIGATIQNDSTILTQVPQKIAHPFMVGFADSMDLIFLCAAVLMVLGCLVLLLMPHVELRAQSAQAAAASEALHELADSPQPVAVGASASGDHSAGAGEPEYDVDEATKPRHSSD